MKEALKLAISIMLVCVCVLALCVMLAMVIVTWWPPHAEGGTFTYSKTLQNSAGTACAACSVKAYRGVGGTLYGTQACNAAGTFTFTLSDSFSFYRMDAKGWDVNAPWRIGPMTWLLEANKIAGDLNVQGRLQATEARPQMYGIAAKNRTLNLSNPRVVSLFFDWGFPWQLEAAERLWQDGIRATFIVAIDSVGALSAPYWNWDDLRELQNMGHEIWQYGGAACYGLGGATRWGNYTTAELDTAIGNCKARLLAQGISPAGFEWPGVDSASYAKTRATIRKHYAVGLNNNGWNPARPYGKVLIEQDTSGITSVGGVACEAYTAAELESLTAAHLGENSWLVIRFIGGPGTDDFITLAPDLHQYVHWCDSLGIQVLPIAEVARQWYGQNWPDFQPLTNGDFHQDMDGDGRPDGWYWLDSLNVGPPAVSRTMIGTANTTINHYGHVIGRTPVGQGKYCIVYPYTSGYCVRGRFTGFDRPATYAFSFWARNDRDDDTTSSVIVELYRESGSTASAGSDGLNGSNGLWGWCAATLPADTDWHKITFSNDRDLLVPTADSMQAVRIYVVGDADTVYVTGFEAHRVNEDMDNGLNRGLIPVNAAQLFFSADYDSVYAITPATTVKKWGLQ